MSPTEALKQPFLCARFLEDKFESAAHPRVLQRIFFFCSSRLQERTKKLCFSNIWIGLVLF